MYKEEKIELKPFIYIWQLCVQSNLTTLHKGLLQKLCFTLRLQTKHDEK